MKNMQWSTNPELNAALELDAKKLADMGVEGYAVTPGERAYYAWWNANPGVAHLASWGCEDEGSHAQWEAAAAAAAAAVDNDREPLVQAVLEAHRAHMQATEDNSRTLTASGNLLEALRALDAWRAP